MSKMESQMESLSKRNKPDAEENINNGTTPKQ